MRTRSTHYDWLRLVEISGPFLSATVLDEAFPNGLDGLDTRVKRDLKRFYYEWLDAYELKSTDFADVHAEWCRTVLREGLGFQDGDLGDGTPYTTQGEGGIGVFSASFALKGVDGAPALFVKVLPADVKPTDKDAFDDWKDTYLEKMTRLCRMHDVRLGLITNGEQWVLVNAPTGGSLSGSVTWYARLWFQEDGTLRAFLSLLGFHRFCGAPKKRLPYLLDESLKHLEEVTDTLGKQVMTAVEVLLEGLDRADLDSGRTLLRDVAPETLYEASLTVMMRLIFILCAEERGLLLLGEKGYDDVYAVSTLRLQLEEDADRFGPEVLERRFDAWMRLLGTFRAVYAGIDHPALDLPAMGGTLFDPDKYPFLEGRAQGESWRDSAFAIHFPLPLPIDNRTVLLLLESLQVLKHKDGAIPLSFRSLDVEQIGYIYEGLLEFTGARAEKTLLGLKGDKTHQNPEVALADLESLRFDDEKKLFAHLKDVTGRSAIKREYRDEPDSTKLALLAKVCRGDEALKSRIIPFLNWMRLSEWGEPVVYHEGSFYVTEGRDRRSSGTHYTPKALTEMIVKEALEPVVYVGPAQGTPRAEWKLRMPTEILSLKVCDPAMGSGAFLVQACRYLADRLVESWSASESEGKAIASDGTVTDYPPNDPMSKIPEDRLCEARRLVAEKCLYGVDINPLAVELAKLSLWLITISKGKPFGFLDHSLKSGDSLLGVSDIRQLVTFRMKPEGNSFGNLATEKIEKAVAAAAAERELIRSSRIRDIGDVNLQMQHHWKVEDLTRRIKDYADYFISTVFVLGKPNKKTNAELDGAALKGAILLNPEMDSVQATVIRKTTQTNLAYDLPAGQTQPRRPFHWAIEFPEVFAQGGFSAIVGNPPFMGGQRLTGSYGTAYRDFLIWRIADGVKGSADLVAYFYLNAYVLLAARGVFALIACNTISQGDTRHVGLEKLVTCGGTIISASPNLPWPGTAGVAISPVGIYKGDDWHGAYRLIGSPVEYISPYLSAQDEWTPKALVANEGKSFQGSILLGLGFTLSEEDALRLIQNDPKNKFVLSPFLNGEDLNTHYQQKPSRWVINFYDWPLDRSANGNWSDSTDEQKNQWRKSGNVPPDYPFNVASDFPDVLEIVRTKVKPERDKLSEATSTNRKRKENWWRYGGDAKCLYQTLGVGLFEKKGMKRYTRALFHSFVSKYVVFSFVPTNYVYAAPHNVFAFDEDSCFAILQSAFHEAWVRKNSSSLETRLRYAPSDCFVTFPFPINATSEECVLGAKLDSLRRAYMSSDMIGLTQLYNHFHDPDEIDLRILEMREIQTKIDVAVRDAYGWTDLDLEHGFHEVGYLPANDNVRFTISESARIEVLKRLAKLNKERWEEEEKAGLHKKGKK